MRQRGARSRARRRRPAAPATRAGRAPRPGRRPRWRPRTRGARAPGRPRSGARCPRRRRRPAAGSVAAQAGRVRPAAAGHSRVAAGSVRPPARIAPVAAQATGAKSAKLRSSVPSVVQEQQDAPSQHRQAGHERGEVGPSRCTHRRAPGRPRWRRVALEPSSEVAVEAVEAERRVARVAHLDRARRRSSASSTRRLAAGRRSGCSSKLTSTPVVGRGRARSPRPAPTSARLATHTSAGTASCTSPMPRSISSGVSPGGQLELAQVDVQLADAELVVVAQVGHRGRPVVALADAAVELDAGRGHDAGGQGDEHRGQDQPAHRAHEGAGDQARPASDQQRSATTCRRPPPPLSPPPSGDRDTTG